MCGKRLPAGEYLSSTGTEGSTAPSCAFEGVGCGEMGATVEISVSGGTVKRTKGRLHSSAPRNLGFTLGGNGSLILGSAVVTTIVGGVNPFVTCSSSEHSVTREGSKGRVLVSAAVFGPKEEDEEELRVGLGMGFSKATFYH